MEGVYLIHTRECINTNKSIYKFGRSFNISNRVRQYPKDSNVEFTMSCSNSILYEKEILKLLRTQFTQATLYGSEYFEGDKNLMINVIFNYLNNSGKQIVSEKEEVLSGREVVSEREAGSGREVGSGREAGSEREAGSGREAGYGREVVNNLHNRTCPKCKHIFRFPSDLKNHFKITYHCKKTNEEINNFFININTNIIKKNIYKCINCNKEFTRKYSLERHLLNTECLHYKNKSTELFNAISTLEPNVIKEITNIIIKNIC